MILYNATKSQSLCNSTSPLNLFLGVESLYNITTKNFKLVSKDPSVCIERPKGSRVIVKENIEKLTNVYMNPVE